LFARHYLPAAGSVEVETVTPPGELLEGVTEGQKGGCPFSG